MYNEANIDGRDLRYINGRVLVNTNSPKVEYLTLDKTRTSALRSSSYGFQEKEVAVFIVELQGFLTFTPGSFVKLIDLGPFNQAFIDFNGLYYTAFVADPVPPKVDQARPIYGNTAYPDGTGRRTLVQVSVFDINTNTYTYYEFANMVQAGFYEDSVLLQAFNPGSLWKGTGGYPGFQLVRTLSNFTV